MTPSTLEPETLPRSDSPTILPTAAGYAAVAEAAAAPATATPIATMTELIGGIVTDAQRLVKQQVELVRSEVRTEIQSAKDAAKFTGLGAILGVIGVLFLAISTVYMLQAAATSLPLWACWAIAGATWLGVGGMIAYCGSRWMTRINPVPQQSINALQENVQCLTNPQK